MAASKKVQKGSQHVAKTSATNVPAQTIQQKVDEYIETQSHLDLLRFITCGSVDDGKSTLIGRMLYEAQMIFEDQVTSLRNDSKKMGTQGVKSILRCWWMALLQSENKVLRLMLRIDSLIQITASSLLRTLPGTSNTREIW